MSTADVLREVWLFSGMEPGELDAMSGFTFQKTFAPGELIVEEGRTGNGLYVVISGKVEVVKGLGTQQQQIVATFGSGEVFGEMALLGEWPRTASVRAVEQADCLGMDRWVFLAQLERHPKVAIKMLQIIAQRLRDTDDRLAKLTMKS